MITPADVDEKIVRLTDMLEDAITDADNGIGHWAIESREAEHAYKVAYAKALLSAKSAPGNGPSGRTTDSEAEATAIVSCNAELRRRLVSEARYEVARERLRSYQSQLDALRTLAANYRAVTR